MESGDFDSAVSDFFAPSTPSEHDVSSPLRMSLRIDDTADNSSGELSPSESPRKTVSPYQCERCKKVFKKRYNLKIHQRSHTGETPFSCNYPGCQLKFKWRSSMMNHQRYHLPQSGTLPATSPATSPAFSHLRAPSTSPSSKSPSRLSLGSVRPASLAVSDANIRRLQAELKLEASTMEEHFDDDRALKHRSLPAALHDTFEYESILAGLHDGTTFESRNMSMLSFMEEELKQADLELSELAAGDEESCLSLVDKFQQLDRWSASQPGNSCS